MHHWESYHGGSTGAQNSPTPSHMHINGLGQPVTKHSHACDLTWLSRELPKLFRNAPQSTLQSRTPQLQGLRKTGLHSNPSLLIQNPTFHISSEHPNIGVQSSRGDLRWCSQEGSGVTQSLSGFHLPTNFYVNERESLWALVSSLAGWLY
jgi:hypothetical protein